MDGELDAVFGMPDVVVVDPGFRVERWMSTPPAIVLRNRVLRKTTRCFDWAVRTCDRLEIAPGEHRLALLSWF